MKGLNLSSFKKHAEDEKSATLVHKDGHKIMLSKKSLSHTQRNQLESLPVHKYAEGTGSAGEEIPFEQLIPQEQADNAPYGTSGMVQATPIQPQQAEASRAPTTVAPAAAPQPDPIITGSMAKVPGYQAEKAANLEAAQALGNQGREESSALKTVDDAIAKLPTQSALVAANKAKNDQLFQDYRDQKIDPNHYWHDHSKIAAGLGMLLSGAGGGDGAMKVVANGIDRDIDAQKHNQNQKMNLWKMNREALGTDLAANLATQNQMLTGLKFKLEKAASNAKGPIALANAHAANARIDQALQMNSFKLSLLNPTSDNPDPSTRVQFLVPPERQQKVFDEIASAQETVKNAPGILKAFDDSADKLHAVDFVPGAQNAHQKALHTLLGPTFKDVEGTVRQAAMDNLFGNTTPQFGDNKNTIATKRDALVGYLRSKSAAPTAKGFGIDLKRFPTTNAEAIGARTPETGLSKSGRPIVKVDGQWVYR